MNKRFLSLLVFLSLVFASAFVLSACDNDKNADNASSGASASVQQSGGQSGQGKALSCFYYIDTDGECVITGVKDNTVTELVLPDEATAIAYDAFRGCDNLTSVVIGDNVTRIGDRAFYGCWNLTTLAGLRTKSPERAFSVLSPAPGTGNLK